MTRFCAVLTGNLGQAGFFVNRCNRVVQCRQESDPVPSRSDPQSWSSGFFVHDCSRVVHWWLASAILSHVRFPSYDSKSGSGWSKMLGSICDFESRSFSLIRYLECFFCASVQSGG